MQAEPRQRWRVTFRRDAAASGLGGRDVQAAIELNLAAVGAPVHGRTQLATSLSIGLASEGELLDVTLSERWEVTRARAVLASALPPGHSLVDCYDVWLGEPALAAQARGATYRIAIANEDLPAAVVRNAVLQLLTSRRIDRMRRKGERTVEYDLRPLIRDVAVDSEGRPMVLRIAVRIDPERGTGRPEEVVAALAERAGWPIEVAATTRLGIILGRTPD